MVTHNFLLNLIFSVKSIRILVFVYINKIWWKYIPDPVITIPWPTHSDNAIDDYRKILEQYCGYQFIGWNWTINPNNSSNIDIKFLVSNRKYATILALQWS